MNERLRARQRSAENARILFAAGDRTAIRRRYAGDPYHELIRRVLVRSYRAEARSYRVPPLIHKGGKP
jgi:hypothetical protein